MPLSATLSNKHAESEHDSLLSLFASYETVETDDDGCKTNRLSWENADIIATSLNASHGCDFTAQDIMIRYNTAKPCAK